MSSSSRSQNHAAASVASGSKRPDASIACGSSRSKLRRWTATYAASASASAAAATRDDSSSWSWASLPEDLVSLIGWWVLAGDLWDYVRFRTSCPRGRGVVDPGFHPRRWMMLPEGYGKLRGFVRFFNLSTGAFVRVQLPLFRDQCVLDSVNGVLLLQRDHDTAIRLLHPFTGDIADFPPLETLLPYVSRSSLGD